MASMCPTSAQQTTTTTAGVSPWAQNYVNTMLGAAGQQVFNMQKDPTTGAMTATGIKPYIPFGAPMNAQGDVVPYGGQQGMGWNMYGGTPQTQGYGQYAPQGQQPAAPMADLTGKQLPSQGIGAAQATDVSPEAFKNTQAYQDFMKGTEGAVGTMDMYESPYFGSQSSGSIGRAMDSAYEKWKQSQQGAQPQQAQQTVTGYPTGTMQAGMGPGEQIAARASVAGPSALQQKAYETAYGMQTPGQYGQATDIAQAAGLGLLNTAGQAQGLQSLAQQAIQQGRQYGQDITDPYRTQAFMSPYMQNVVAAQQREARRASDIMGQSQKAQAAKAGAFGGARQAIMESERRRNLATQMGDIQAQGLQAAFQNAQQQQLAAQQQAMQGYTAGIQGYGQGISGQTGAYGQAAGAGTALGGLGGQQLSSAQTIANLQNLYGQQQQQNQQNVINQAMQNYQLQRLYPQQQIQYMSSLLSGLPVSSSGQVANIPGPNLLSQLGGLGTAAVGAYGLYNKLFPGGKKGGNVRSDAGGGIASIGLSKALKN